MSRKARNRAAAAALILLLAGTTLAVGQVTGTFAVFTAETENQNAIFQGGWVPLPSGTSDSVTAAKNSTITLSWTSGRSAPLPTNNPVNAQQIWFADGGSGGSSSCGTYALLKTASAGAGSATDTTVPTPADWLCYEVESTTAGNWTSAFVTFPPIQLLVPTDVHFSNKTGGTAGTIENGDTIAITYNQNIAVAPSSVQVCAWSSGGTLNIDDTHSGTCNAKGDATASGKVTGLTITANKAFGSSGTSVAGNVLTITLGGGASTTTVSGSGTFVPTNSDVTASPSGLNVCTATTTPDCRASTSGNF